MRLRRGLVATCLALALTGCPSVRVVPTAVGTPRVPKPDPSPSALESTAAMASPAVAGVIAGSLKGRVLDQLGKPVAGVPVTAWMLSDSGGGLVSNNSGGYRLFADDDAEALTATTDADGRFTLDPPKKSRLNLEARSSDELKAALQDVGSTDDVTLKLEFTGTIEGHVTSPDDPEVSNFAGVDVYIPGLPYSLKTDAAGHFALTGVPVGAFDVVASKLGLGEATSPKVKVEAKATTKITLSLKALPPALTSLQPAYGLPGDVITLKGERFAATSGTPFQVYFGGKSVSQPKRTGDGTMTFVVPEGATSGTIGVRVGEVDSNTLPFDVLVDLALTPTTSDLLVGDTQTMVAKATIGTDKTVPLTAVSWSVDGTAFTVDTNGLLTAKAEGAGTVKVTAGSLKASQAIRVHAVKVDVATIAKTGLGSTDRHLESAAVDGGGHLVLLVDDFELSPSLNRHSLLKVGADGTSTAIPNSSMTGSPTHLVAAGTGDLLVMCGSHLQRLNTQGTLADVTGSDASVFHEPAAIAGDAFGNVYVMDAEPGALTPSLDRLYTYRLYRIGPDGLLTKLSESLEGTGDGAAMNAKFSGVSAMALSPDGKFLYVAETRSQDIRQVDTSGLTHPVTTLVKGTGTTLANTRALAVIPGNQLLIMDGPGVFRRLTTDAHLVDELTGGASDFVRDEVGATPSLTTSLVNARGMGVDATGHVIVTTAGDALKLTFTRRP